MTVYGAGMRGNLVTNDLSSNEAYDGKIASSTQGTTLRFFITKLTFFTPVENWNNTNDCQPWCEPRDGKPRVLNER